MMDDGTDNNAATQAMGKNADDNNVAADVNAVMKTTR